MLELLKTSLTVEDLNKIKIFAAFIDKEFKTHEKADMLKEGIDEFVSDINKNNSYKVIYKAFYPPESEYFMVEFMKTTTLLRIMGSIDKHDQDPFRYAESEFQVEVGRKLQILMNSLK